MQLRQWLFDNEVSQTQLCNALEISRCHLSSYIRKRFRISKKLARNIERYTNGEVTFDELMKHNPEKSTKPKRKRKKKNV